MKTTYKNNVIYTDKKYLLRTANIIEFDLLASSSDLEWRRPYEKNGTAYVDINEIAAIVHKNDMPAQVFLKNGHILEVEGNCESVLGCIQGWHTDWPEEVEKK